MSNDLFGLKGKSALIIGGGLGMGESTALMLAQVGCGSAIVDIEADRAERVAGKVTALGCKSAPIVGNVFNDHEVNEIVAKAEKQMGGLDVMVSIVGQALFSSALEITPEQWDMEIRRNIRYAFFVSQAFAKSLIQQKKQGAITCIGSVSGLQSAPMHAVYGVAKLGMVNLVRSLACEWSQYGIRINVLAPGAIDTPRMHAAGQHLSELIKAVPMGRQGTTEEIAKAALFLSSDLASYVTGSVLSVDGGWMAANIWQRAS